MLKKSMTLLLLLFAGLAQAQGDGYRYKINQEIFEITAAIAVTLMVMLFILAVIKRYLDHKLKNKIVDKGISENMAASLLQTTPAENGNQHIKWFAILAGIAGGLTAVNYTQPLGIHSLAIMSFSLALAFLGYYFFVKNSTSQKQ